MQEPVNFSYSLEPCAEFIDKMLISVRAIDGLARCKRYLKSKRAVFWVPTIEYGESTAQIPPD